LNDRSHWFFLAPLNSRSIREISVHGCGAGSDRRISDVITQRKPTCDMPVSGAQLCRALGRYREQ
jgi:hypothetical protein